MSTWQELHNNPRLAQIYKQRTDIIRLIRAFFWSKNFIETDTPIAVRLPSQEPYLHFMPLTMHDPYSDPYPMYLRTSPEFALKKLLAAGYEKIFEIGKCFRDNESFGGTHNPEFTMIEWYRSPGTLTDIMDDVEALFKYVGENIGVNELVYESKHYKLGEKWDRLTMKEVWQKYTGINLDNNLTLEQLSNTARQKGYSLSETDAYEDVFFKIFLNEIEPKLGLEKPLFVYDYPAQMASLSTLCSHDPRYAERMECYVGGLELCNAFGELTDAVDQKNRLEADRALRQKLGKETWPVDEDFIAGLPEIAKRSKATAGIALGVDRMVVLCTGARDTNEVIFGSMKDQYDSQ